MSLSTTHCFPHKPGLSFTRFVMVSALAGLSITAAVQSVEAASFLTGKSNGMKKCVRAILGGYEVKRVNVHGHHFNCKPLVRKTSSSGGQYRHIWLSHSQRGKDDQVYFIFYVDSLNRVRPNLVKRRINKGISIGSLAVEFQGPANMPDVVDYAFYAEQARSIRPAKVDNWKTAASQIATVVIAELGNPDNRGTAPKQVSCDLPTFYEHDNFRGRRYRLGGSQPNFHKVMVNGKHMGDVISSMCVPRGCKITAYSLPNYSGFKYEFNGPRAFEDLKRQKVANGQRLNWGDMISSVRVSR